MGRLVQPSRIISVEPPTGGLEGMIEGDPGQPRTRVVQGDTYLERVAKYVPSELVAFYIFANPILLQSLKEPGTMAGYSVSAIGKVIFFAAWVLTPIYLFRLGKPEDARLINIVAATALFPVWAYAVQGVGPTQYVPFDGHLASIVLGGASLVSGLLVPRATKVPAGAA